MTLSNTATPKYYGKFRYAVMQGKIPVNKEISMEMNRIDSLIANPNYFYDVLPFAYVLEVTNKWIKKFENVSVIDPSWEASHTFYSFSNLQKVSDFLDTLNSNVY